ncbi:MAG: TetR/AcrR family transcriptional regulator [Actinobacteria bacterium]|jgi:AcrR family transcriptional regulator|nr:MAG: TetR/AcrR family transcriptional regulator [Actinomycetota bacterium]
MAGVDRREQILLVAEALFSEKGFKGSTLREIAEGVNIKTPGLYNYFKSKGDIYNSLIVYRFNQLKTAVLDRIKEASEFKEQVRMLALLLIDFWADHPGLPRILAEGMMLEGEHTVDELISNFWVPVFNEVAGTLEESGTEQNGLQKHDIHLLVFNVFGMTSFYFFAGQVYSMLTGEDGFSPDNIERLKKTVIGTLFNGIAFS